MFCFILLLIFSNLTLTNHKQFTKNVILSKDSHTNITIFMIEDLDNQDLTTSAGTRVFNNDWFIVAITEFLEPGTLSGTHLQFRVVNKNCNNVLATTRHHDFIEGTRICGLINYAITLLEERLLGKTDRYTFVLIPLWQKISASWRSYKYKNYGGSDKKICRICHRCIQATLRSNAKNLRASHEITRSRNDQELIINSIFDSTPFETLINAGSAATSVADYDFETSHCEWRALHHLMATLKGYHSLYLLIAISCFFVYDMEQSRGNYNYNPYGEGFSPRLHTRVLWRRYGDLYFT